MRLRRCLPVVAVLVCLAPHFSHGTIVINGYDSNVHDRFDSNSFIGAGQDWTGVGKSGSTWATLVSPRVIISANHFHPSIGANVVFWTGNNSNDPTVQRTVVSGQRIGNTDIWLGLLNTAVDNTITHYPLAPSIANIATSLGSYEGTPDTMGYIVGQGPANSSISFSVGRNAFDVSDVTPSLNGTFDAIGMIEDLGAETNFAADGETFLQANDSGAPSFIVGNSGGLELVGVHSYTVGGVTTANFAPNFSYRTPSSALFAASGRRISFDNFVPNHVTPAIIAAVPEPSAFLLVGLLASLMGCGNRLGQLLKLRKS